MGRNARKKLERRAFRHMAPVVAVEIAGRVFADIFTPDCCINGTWVLVEALRRFKITAVPLACQTLVLNPTAWRLAREQQVLPEDSATEAAWQEQGAWVLQVAPRAGRPGYGFHVVSFSQGFLLDVASGQFARPQKNISIPASLAVRVDPGDYDALLAGKHNAVLENTEGAAVVYGVVPSETGYQRAPGWRNSPHNLQAVARICTELQRREKEIERAYEVEHGAKR